MISAARRLGRFLLRLWCRVGRAPGWLYMTVERWGPLLGDGTPVSAVLPNGCRLECDLNDHIQRQIYFIGVYEAPEAFLLSRLLSPGMVFVDAGANIGQYTLLASTAVGPSGAVHSFEPVPANFGRLRRLVEANGLLNVVLNQAALWSEDGTVAVAPGPGVEGNAGAYAVTANGRGAAAVAVRLDGYAASRGLTRLDVVKMDIEGAEPFAIRGGRRVLEEFRPILLMEVSRVALANLGETPASLWELLSGMGYRAWLIGHSPETGGPAADLAAISTRNVLFHRDDLPTAVRRGWSSREALRWARGGWGS